LSIDGTKAQLTEPPFSGRSPLPAGSRVPPQVQFVTVGTPIKLSASPTTITPSPLLGQHREEILKELGYFDADIAALVKDGAV
jgi:crotonobetainyl-CoA:carnitine CoA-transferase CaiB-like acyl-CoA transferase